MRASRTPATCVRTRIDNASPWPRSIRQMEERESPHRRPSSSCVQPRLRRRARTARPNRMGSIARSMALAAYVPLDANRGSPNADR